MNPEASLRHYFIEGSYNVHIYIYVYITTTFHSILVLQIILKYIYRFQWGCCQSCRSKSLHNHKYKKGVPLWILIRLHPCAPENEFLTFDCSFLYALLGMRLAVTLIIP